MRILYVTGVVLVIKMKSLTPVSTLRTHSKKFLTEVIELYKSHPCLWRMGSKDYSDRDKKTEAYGVLIEKFKQVTEDKDSVDRYLVAKKINCLRASYRFEKKKAADAVARGKEHTPGLWCFELLRFLDENDNYQKQQQQQPETSFVSVDVDDVNDHSNYTCESPEYLQVSMDGVDLLPPNPSPTPSETSNVTPKRPKRSEESNISKKTTTSSRKSQSKYQNARKRKVKHPDNNSINTVYRRHVDESASDKRRRVGRLTQFDYAAKAWALALNNLSTDQQLYASRVINEVIFQAQIGKLSEDTSLVINVPNSPEIEIGLDAETESEEIDVKGENLKEYPLIH